MRAFVAVDSSSGPAIASLQKEILAGAGGYSNALRPVDVRNLHFTLLFLGEISDSDAGRVQSKLAALQFDNFEFFYSGVGAFPRDAAARVIWVGVAEEGARKLTGLAKMVVAELSELGFGPDRPFSPHLTIFRVKSRLPLNLAEGLKKFKEVEFGSDKVEALHLKKSDLTPAGPVYSNVYTVEGRS